MYVRVEFIHLPLYQKGGFFFNLIENIMVTAKSHNSIVRNSAGDARVIWSIFSGYHPQGLRDRVGHLLIISSAWVR